MILLKVWFNPLPLTYNAIYPSKLFWCEWPRFGDMDLLSNIMELDGLKTWGSHVGTIVNVQKEACIH